MAAEADLEYDQGECEGEDDGCATYRQQQEPLTLTNSQTAQDPECGDRLSGKKKRKKKVAPPIRVNLSCCKYEVLRIVQRKLGWREVGDDEEWELYWTDTSVNIERVMKLNKTQKINHFNGMLEICRKKSMARNLQKMQRLFPETFNFFPKTFILPNDMQEFLADVKVRGKKQVYILKPDAGCQGKGIRLCLGGKEEPVQKTLSEMPTPNVVAQHYLPTPFLIHGLKFDLRIYALVLSCDPLRVFIFHEGLARFCTEPYSTPKASNLDVAFMHLTNYAVNKKNENFIANSGGSEQAEDASKWSLKQLADHMKAEGHNWERVWADIADLIIKSLISIQPILRNNYRSVLPPDNDGFSCFEVLGYDIMLDEALQPWLIEVNHSPSFNIDSPLDLAIKEQLITDTIQLVRVDPKLIQKSIKAEKLAAASRLLEPMHKKKPKDGSPGANAPASASAAPEEDSKAPNLKPKTAEEYQSMRAEVLAKREKYEAKHSGGFTRIYPSPDASKQAFYEQLLAGSQEIFSCTYGAKVKRAIDSLVDDKKKKDDAVSDKDKAEKAKAKALRDRLAQMAAQRRQVKLAAQNAGSLQPGAGLNSYLVAIAGMQPFAELSGESSQASSILGSRPASATGAVGGSDLVTYYKVDAAGRLVPHMVLPARMGAAGDAAGVTALQAQLMQLGLVPQQQGMPGLPGGLSAALSGANAAQGLVGNAAASRTDATMVPGSYPASNQVSHPNQLHPAVTVTGQPISAASSLNIYTKQLGPQGPAPFLTFAAQTPASLTITTLPPPCDPSSWQQTPQPRTQTPPCWGESPFNPAQAAAPLPCHQAYVTYSSAQEAASSTSALHRSLSSTSSGVVAGGAAAAGAATPSLRGKLQPTLSASSQKGDQPRESPALMCPGGRSSACQHPAKLVSTISLNDASSLEQAEDDWEGIQIIYAPRPLSAGSSMRRSTNRPSSPAIPLPVTNLSSGIEGTAITRSNSAGPPGRFANAKATSNSYAMVSKAAAKGIVQGIGLAAAQAQELKRSEGPKPTSNLSTLLAAKMAAETTKLSSNVSQSSQTMLVVTPRSKGVVHATLSGSIPSATATSPSSSPAGSYGNSNSATPWGGSSASDRSQMDLVPDNSSRCSPRPPAALTSLGMRALSAHKPTKHATISQHQHSNSAASSGQVPDNSNGTKAPVVMPFALAPATQAGSARLRDGTSRAIFHSNSTRLQSGYITSQPGELVIATGDRLVARSMKQPELQSCALGLELQTRYGPLAVTAVAASTKAGSTSARCRE